MLNIVLAASWLVISAGATPASSTSNCREVSFTVSGTAENRNLSGISLDLLSGSPDIDYLITLYNDAPLIEVSGEQVIEATYCEPTKKNANNDKLQMLFGSITTNRDGWQALGGLGTDFPEYKPEEYHWVNYANAEGFPTLAIDRLGHGKSSHPDPILTVQAPYEIELYNDLAKQVRSGHTQFGRSYDHLIYIGNSYGSELGTGIAGAHPDAYDEYILTGFTSTVQKGLIGVLLTLALPAQIVDPARFGSLPLGYVMTANQLGRTASFFGTKDRVAFEDEVADLFYHRQDVVALGQVLSVYAVPYFGGEFTGRVLNLIGEQDQIFCGLGSALLSPAGTCGSQPSDTEVLFPSADYNWKSVDKIGHAVQLHERSQVYFKVAHEFLNGQSFAGGDIA